MKLLGGIAFLLLVTISSFGQVPRSEIIEQISIIKIKGDKLERTDSVTLQINERLGDNDAENWWGGSLEQGDGHRILFIPFPWDVT